MCERILKLDPRARTHMKQEVTREAAILDFLNHIDEIIESMRQEEKEFTKKTLETEQEEKKEYWNASEAMNMFEIIERNNDRKISSVLFPKENGLYVKVLRADNGVIIAKDNYNSTDKEMSEVRKVNQEENKPKIVKNKPKIVKNKPKIVKNEPKEDVIPKELRDLVERIVEHKSAADEPVLKGPLKEKFRRHDMHSRLSKIRKCKSGECKHNGEVKYKQPEPAKTNSYTCEFCGAEKELLNGVCVVPSNGALKTKTVLCDKCFNKLFGELKPAIERRLKMGVSDKAPEHYKALIQPVEAIKMWGLDFTIGNIVKYAARVGKKKDVDPIDDLNKIIHYAEIAKKEILNKRY